MVKVVRLRPDVDQDVVEALERYLSWAKEGRLRAFAFASISKGDLIGTSWYGDASRHLVLAAATGLQARLAKHWVEGLEDMPDGPVR